MLRVFSPSKLNLFLKVLGKREDGYHELASLFQATTLGDFLECTLSDTDNLTCSDLSLPVNENNLILKAAQLYRKKTGIKIGLKVHLDKKIPIQAGLGGGSSNAATTLWAFNQLLGQPVTEQELQKWSAEIGSDIPFFFSQGTAYCTGRGENVNCLPPLKTQKCWIVKPHFGLSTPEIFKKLQANPYSVLENPFSFNPNGDLNKTSFYFNDLEKPAFEIQPTLLDIKNELLESGFETVMMTGSGSAFFCFGQGKIKRSDLLAFEAQFLNRPLNTWY